MAASKDFSLIFNIGGKLNSTFSGALGKVTKNLEGIEKKAKSVGKVMSAMSAIGVAGIGASVKTAIDFEAAMSKVGAISRANKEDLDRLAKTARDLGASTAWTASQAADGMEFLAMAGFKTNDIISAMPGMLSLASAGAVELGVAADIASNILTGFGLKASDMGRVSDVMTNAFTQSNVTVAMLGDTMKYVAPVAESLGVSIETTAAMAGKLGDAGIQASMAGTAMRSIMGRLAAPPKAAAKALQSLNVQTKDAKGNLRDLPTILAEIEEKTSKMGNAQKSGIFKAIAGEEAFSAMSVLAKQAGTGDLQKFVKKMEEVGSADRVAKKMLDNTKGSIIMLKSALEGIMITVGNEFLPVITRLTDKATEVVSKFQEWSQANPELFSKLAKVAAVSVLVVGALGALAVGMWALAGPLRLLITLLKSMAWLTKGAFTVLLMLGKGLLFVGKAALWASGKLLMFVLRGIGMLAKGAVFVAIKTLTMLGKALLFVGRMALISGRFMLANPIILAITVIVGLIYLLYKNWDKVSKFISDSWVSIKAAFGTGVEWIKTKFSSVMEWFASLPSKFSEFGKNLIQGLINGISGMAGAAVEKAKAVASSIADAVKGFFGINSPSKLFMQFGEWNMQGLANGMQAQAPQTANTAQTALGGVLPSVSPQQASQGLRGGGGAATLTLTQEIHIAAGTSEEQAKSIADQSFKQFESKYNSMMNKRQRVAY